MGVSILRVTAAVSLLTLSCLAHAASSDAELIAHGRYIATAGDCSACHQEPRKGGSLFGGGAPLASPVGPIYASNITPDPQHGIGGWSFEQFKAAMTEGKSPTKGMLYPAMPYTAYASMSDDDLRALYTYLMKDVAPSSNEPPQTHLPFPFIRQAMRGWNLLFVRAEGTDGASAPAGSVARGHYVAQALEHCSTCHTPRNALMAEDGSKLLSGAQVGNWYAPNITPDATGIGGWSDEQLTQFLTQGHNHMAVAGGDMGVAVQRSLSQLQPADVTALVAYLRSVPPVATPGAPVPLHEAPGVDVAAVEPQQAHDLNTLANATTVNGAQLYQAACAACHSAGGGGSVDGKHPDLVTNSAVRLGSPDNLIMTIADGVHRTVNGKPYAMPGFAAELNNAQIGALATYVRETIGGVSGPAITAADVKRVRGGDLQETFLTRYAMAMALAAMVVALIIVVLIALRVTRRPRLAH